MTAFVRCNACGKEAPSLTRLSFYDEIGQREPSLFGVSEVAQ